MRVIGADTYPDEYVLEDVFALPVAKIAAGADLSFTVPVGVIWDVVSLTALFTASAAAANRVPRFFVKNEAGVTVYQYNVSAAITAAQTATFTFSEDVVTPPTFANGGNFLAPLPSTWFPSNWSFGTTTAAIDTGDQWSNINVWVKAWLPKPGE